MTKVFLAAVVFLATTAAAHAWDPIDPRTRPPCPLYGIKCPDDGGRIGPAPAPQPVAPPTTPTRRPRDGGPGRGTGIG